jgi:PKHD-type hydroxylase
VTVSLSNSNDYEGGELEFDLRNKHPDEKNFLKCEEILPKGSLVVFPSFLWHRVNPVKEGVRKSLVIWCLGYEFKWVPYICYSKWFLCK